MPRPQFSIKTLLWLMVVVGAFCAGIRYGRYSDETKILAALDKTTQLAFTDQPLSDVVEYLKAQYGIQIQFDTKAMATAGAGPNTPITFWINGVKLRSALKLMLSEHDLSYEIRNETLVITSKTNAESLRTLLWLAVVVAVFLGGIQFGRLWRRADKTS